MFGSFNKVLDMLSLDALKGVSVNRRLELLKPKPKSLIDITLRIEKLSGKCILEKENDLVLRNFVNFLYHMLANFESYNLPNVTFIDVNGNSYTNYLGTSATNAGYPKLALGMYNEGSVGDANTGIVIGTGTTPPTRTNYALQNKIPHGTGTGQIYYNQQSYELLNEYSFRLNREFTNAGSDLSVAEAGLIYAFRVGATTVDGKYNILLLRDTFTPISVTAGNGIRVRYTFSF
jgi:hypothetical protein